MSFYNKYLDPMEDYTRFFDAIGMASNEAV